jgi:hypothetical protein
LRIIKKKKRHQSPNTSVATLPHRLKGRVGTCVEKRNEEEEEKLRLKARSLAWAKAQRAARLLET